MAAAAATLSDSGPAARSGMVQDVEQFFNTGAEIPSRSDPRQRVTGELCGAGLAPPSATMAILGSGVASRPPFRKGWVKTEPMLALTAPGENGSAVPGPRTTVASSNASTVRRIVPTFPGSERPSRKTQVCEASEAHSIGQIPITLVPDPSPDARSSSSGSTCSPSSPESG